MTGITTNDANVTEDREMPLIEVRCDILVKFSGEELSEHGSFKSCDILD
ncbi:hypothetical protein [Halalkalicoccus tibetensis]|uniref:Uncharacterized protein n=1 Tax=Halalkalicoccus tibetensis TaxID=175632 RepID=A0ABD5VAV3_9EURY